MADWIDEIILQEGTDREKTIDITFTRHTPQEVVLDQIGALNAYYNQTVHRYLDDVEVYARTQGLAGRRRAHWESIEQLHIANRKSKTEGRGPSLDHLRGEAKKVHAEKFQSLLATEEDALARHIIVQALRHKVDMIKTMIMSRQSAMSAQVAREKSAQYTR